MTLSRVANKTGYRGNGFFYAFQLPRQQQWLTSGAGRTMRPFTPVEITSINAKYDFLST